MSEVEELRRRVAALEEGLRAFLPDEYAPDGEYDEEHWWWNHPEWPDDESLCGETVGHYREARALLAERTAEEASS